MICFVRHNDGSFWADEVGWPWPKHSCYQDCPEPQWFVDLRKDRSVRIRSLEPAQLLTEDSSVRDPQLTEERRAEVEAQAVAVSRQREEWVTNFLSMFLGSPKFRVWGVFDDSLKLVAFFAPNNKSAADDFAILRKLQTGISHTVLAYKLLQRDLQ